MKNRAKFFFFCCFCLLSLTGRGEVFRGVTIADGLSSLLVNSLYKDSNGFIWIGTDLSLDRFDGVAFKQYA
ncbi:MAG: two-component regulator propeller domain-containing protein, partial [Bacteroidales bacterium]|nr:two-component regulator propeller domain-containing protein [Bacteroidales bacterium]